MFFILSTPTYSKTLSNTSKIKVYLRNGIAEIFDQHQDLMGQVENNLLEIESTFENKSEKFVFALQDAVFVVSTKGLDSNADLKGTYVYVYARDAREINSTLSLDDLTKQYEQKNSIFEKEIEKAEEKAEAEAKAELKSGLKSQLKSDLLRLSSRNLLLKREVEFLRRVIVIVKNLRS